MFPGVLSSGFGSTSAVSNTYEHTRFSPWLKGILTVLDQMTENLLLEQEEIRKTKLKDAEATLTNLFSNKAETEHSHPITPTESIWRDSHGALKCTMVDRLHQTYWGMMDSLFTRDQVVMQCAQSNPFYLQDFPIPTGAERCFVDLLDGLKGLLYGAIGHTGANARRFSTNVGFTYGQNFPFAGVIKIHSQGQNIVMCTDGGVPEIIYKDKNGNQTGYLRVVPCSERYPDEFRVSESPKPDAQGKKFKFKEFLNSKGLWDSTALGEYGTTRIHSLLTDENVQLACTKKGLRWPSVSASIALCLAAGYGVAIKKGEKIPDISNCLSCFPDMFFGHPKLLKDLGLDIVFHPQRHKQLYEVVKTTSFIPAPPMASRDSDVVALDPIAAAFITHGREASITAGRDTRAFYDMVKDGSKVGVPGFVIDHGKNVLDIPPMTRTEDAMKNYHTSLKADNSRFTHLDKWASSQYRSTFKRGCLVEIPLVTEETSFDRNQAEIEKAKASKDGRMILVDELDNTGGLNTLICSLCGIKEYEEKRNHRNYNVTVNSAMVEWALSGAKRGVPTYGILYQPLDGAIYYNDENHVYKREPRNKDKVPTSMADFVEPVKLSKDIDYRDEHVVRCAVGGDKAIIDAKRILTNAGKQFSPIPITGQSRSIELFNAKCDMVLNGKMMPWDIAPSVAMAVKLGFVVATLDPNDTLDFHSQDVMPPTIIAHPKLIEKLREHNPNITVQITAENYKAPTL